MDERIVQGLKSQFEKHRIVFWYDSKREMREQFDNLEMDKVEKIEIDNNEFSIKHRILRLNPKKKFLIYKFGSEPEKLTDNWLLDVQLSYGQFRTDQIQMWLNELSLDLGFADTVQLHEEFFRSKQRVESLKSLLTSNDDKIALKGKMLLVSTGSKQDMEGIISTLFEDLAKSDDKTLKLLKRCNLDKFLWEQLDRRYGYAVKNPTIADFALELFKSCYQQSQNQESMMNAEAYILLQRWKNDRNNKETFEQLSSEFQDALLITKDNKEKDFRSLIEIDYFEEIDRHIIRSLVQELSAQTLSRTEVQNFIRTRRKTHWFSNYEHVYESILYASEFLHEMSGTSLGMDGFENALNIYTKTWFKIDQLYRKFIFHLKKSSQITLLGDIGELIENKYGNDYLLRLNDAWQKQVDPISEWKSANVQSQRDFYKNYVRELRRKGTKCIVIISDALRYEIGEELHRRICEKDKFDAKIEPILASLPSYTQLGMASLLPEGDLGIFDPSKPTVMHAGVSTAGIENRKKVLDANISEDRSCAYHTDVFLSFKNNETRDIIRDHDVIFIYHNRIDATGDSTTTEENVFEAAEDTIEELVALVRKLTSANAGHIIITSDHGFIYQNRDLDPSDYLGSKPEGQEILYTDRRFVLGKGLLETSSFKKFTSDQLKISGDFDILFPKSINRLRKSGSGAKFVHGGVSLQEVIIPVLSITKGRQSDASAVDIDILTGSSKTISTSQMSVVLYQKLPVTPKTHARTLRIGLYGDDGKLLSNQQEVVFDIESEDPRDREQKVQVLLSKQADEYNNKDVVLRLDEQHPGTTHYKEYSFSKYIIRRTFTNDFDF